LDAWQEYDPGADGWISIHEFICLIIELDPPFGNADLADKCRFTGPGAKKRF